MATKSHPFTDEEIRRYAKELGSPFHIYDEATIRDACRRLNRAFDWVPEFKNYFAVKATPNPAILRIVSEEGCGLDCSSMAELLLAESVGVSGEDIYFTSNNAPIEEFAKAKQLGAVLNLDAFEHVQLIQSSIGLPRHVSFRYNPGSFFDGQHPREECRNSKFGMTKPQIFAACRLAQSYGVNQFGLHIMIGSNFLGELVLVRVARAMFDLAVEIKIQTGISITTINLGSGLGIPYHPEQKPLDLNYLGNRIQAEYNKTIEAVEGLAPVRIVYECGRLITGPAGFLLTRVIHKKQTYKSYVGVDASIANLLRPGMYNSYHHMTVVKAAEDHNHNHAAGTNGHYGNGHHDNDDEGPPHIHDVVGSLMENIDKLATDRNLGVNVQVGDVILIHDTGAHGHTKGFNYNGKLRSAEYLRRSDSTVVQIRRAETYKDLFATLQL